MENKEIVLQYLHSLEDSLRRIRHMDFTIDMVFGDEDTQDLLDRRMQKAIEACIDIAVHVASQLKLPRQEKVSDVFKILAIHKVIDIKLAEKLRGATGFRNILVHEYTEVDYRLAYSDLESKLQDLEAFAYQINQFLLKSDRA